MKTLLKIYHAVSDSPLALGMKRPINEVRPASRPELRDLKENVDESEVMETIRIKIKAIDRIGVYEPEGL